MKAAALYHLLQVRARKFEESAEPKTMAFLREIQTSLEVEYANSEYRLAWRHAGQPHTLRVSSDAFSFYLAGDNDAAIAARKSATGYRAVNWSGAAAVWRQVASTSGVALSLTSNDGLLGLAPVQPGTWPVSWRRLAVLGSPAAALAVALAAGGRPIGSSGVALFATALAGLLCAMPPWRALTLTEAGLLSVGAIAPLTYGLAPLLLLGPLAGMVTACVAERMTGTRSLALWLLAGAILSVSGARYPVAAISAAVVLITLGVTTFLAPAKLPRQAVAFFGIGAAVGLAAAALVGAFPAPVPSIPDAGTGSPGLVAGVVGGALVLGFCLWCTQGVLFRVVPWFCILALGVFAVAAVVRGDRSAAVSATAVSGFTIFLGARIVQAWAVSMRPGDRCPRARID
jgi:hypothetical protein